MMLDKTSTTNLSSLQQNTPEYIVLHSTHQYDAFDKLFEFHTSLGWAGVGYHVFIDKEGTVFQARPFEVEGAHAKGLNKKSIGICIYSESGVFSQNNVAQLKEVLKDILQQFPKMEILSHTQAQLLYFQDLASQLDISFIPFDQQVFENCNDEQIFLMLEKKIKDKAMFLELSHKEFANELKKFKNCPGTHYKSLL